VAKKIAPVDAVANVHRDRSLAAPHAWKQAACKQIRKTVVHAVEPAKRQEEQLLSAWLARAPLRARQDFTGAVTRV